MNRKPTIIDLILSRSTAAVDERDSWDGSNEQRSSFASDRFPHRALRLSTALHYACLVGDIEIVKVLLRHGAKWTISDSIGLLPEYYIDVSSGDGKRLEFKRLCEEETLKQLKKREQEDELRRAKELEEKEESKRLTKLEEESKRLTKLEEESKRLKELAGEEEAKRLKKLEDEEALLERRRRQSKCFPSPPLTVLMHFFTF
jgi:ATP-dependent Clp protease ATP-binding subunit ClpB